MSHRPSRSGSRNRREKAIVNAVDVIMFLGVLTVLFITLIRVMMSHPDSTVGRHWRESWIQPIMFHRFWCKKHGWVVDYPHGWNEILACPLCTMEQWRTEQREALDSRVGRVAQ